MQRNIPQHQEQTECVMLGSYNNQVVKSLHNLTITANNPGKPKISRGILTQSYHHKHVYEGQLF